MKPQIVAILLCVALAGCNEWSLDTHWKSDGYRLIAVDTESQMSLISEDSGVSLVGPTVFSIGADTKYIVVKQHPATEAGAFSVDRSITNYLIVEKCDGDFSERKKGVQGPLKKEEFDRLSDTLTLPSFSKTFHELE